MEYVLKWWPLEKEQVDVFTREYWNFRVEMDLEDAMLLKSDRTVALRSLRAEVQYEIHGALLGERANAFALPEIMFSGLPPLVSATTWRKYLRGLESHRKFSATTDRSTATLDIGSATTMSFKNEAATRALHRGTQRRFFPKYIENTF